MEFDIKVKQKDITIYKIFDLPKAVQKYTAIIKNMVYLKTCAHKSGADNLRKKQNSHSLVVLVQ